MGHFAISAIKSIDNVPLDLKNEEGQKFETICINFGEQFKVYPKNGAHYFFKNPFYSEQFMKLTQI